MCSLLGGFPPKLIEHEGPGLFYSRRAIHVQFVFLAYSMNSHSALPLWVLDQTPSDTAQNNSPLFRQLGRANKKAGGHKPNVLV